jgi:hypothetical protein
MFMILQMKDHYESTVGRETRKSEDSEDGHDPKGEQMVALLKRGWSRYESPDTKGDSHATPRRTSGEREETHIKRATIDRELRISLFWLLSLSLLF